MSRIFLSNKTITCLASWVHTAEDTRKILHIKYKNLLHIHPLTSQNNSLYLTSSMNVLWQQLVETSHDGQTSVHTVHVLPEHRSTQSHLFSLLFLVSEYTNKRWKGKVMGIWWRSGQFHCVGKRYYRQTHWQL